MAALRPKVPAQPLVSNSHPPIEAPAVEASWVASTIGPPPAPASSGSVLLGRTPQPTGAGVPIRPQPASNAAVAAGQCPKATRAAAMAPPDLPRPQADPSPAGLVPR